MNRELETSTPKIDLFELMNGMIKTMKHLWLTGFLLVFVLTLGLSIHTFVSYTPMYQASASFTVRVSNPFYASTAYYNTSAAEQMAKTFPYILTSGVLSEKVEEELGISYMPSVSATALGNTNIFTLNVTSSDPKLAYQVLQCVMEIYPSVSEFVVGSTTLTLLNDSGIPQHPINPLSYTSSFMKGIVLGGGIWLCICLFYWFTHQTIMDEEELGKLVNLSCLGRLPKVRGFNKKNSDHCPVLSEHNDKFGFNESVRLLRVRVEKAMEKHNAKVLLVSSTIANEGKTTISMNLATALAQKGKKTLLIDCDLRNPSVAGAFGMSEEIGLSDYLRGEQTIKSVLKRINYENLFVVFGGKPVSNPEDLLNRAQMQEMMKAARVTFDYIILDTPPCALLSDASEICALADCALLTVRQDFACKDQILEGVQILNDAERPILGCVLNMTKPKAGKSSYSYYGYYGQYGARKQTQDKEVKEYA
ncbi:MAG: formate--tetrahydrofolate ligase [Erysipelotrichaceae bacterium]|nr:formate--tetrahydrofolate ligase [Erysipelotrichaceae bacterium]